MIEKIVSVFYVIVKCISLPGTAMKAFIEHIMCRMYKVPIEDRRCLRKNEMCGHVEHEMIDGTARSFFFAFIPFFINLILGLIFIADSSITFFYFQGYAQLFPAIKNLNIMNFDSVYLFIEIMLSIIGLWLGISFLTNLFPLMEDSAALWESIYDDPDSSLAKKILLAPFASIFYVGSQMEALGLTFLTSIAVAYGFPYFLLLFIH